MTPENFCYWLQGYFELVKTTELTPEQVQEIKKHLFLAFDHVIDDKERLKNLVDSHNMTNIKNSITLKHFNPKDLLKSGSTISC